MIANDSRIVKKVNDWWVFAVLYPIMAVSVIYIGNDNTFQQLLVIPSFYSDVLIAFLSTYGIGYYFRNLFFFIGRKFNWENQLRQRLIYQFISGLLLPTFTLVITEIIYLNVLEIPLQESSIFYLEMPLIILFCAIINLIYSFLYFRQYSSALHGEFSRTQRESAKDTFIASSGNQFTSIAGEDVSYFISQNKICFLVTTAGKRYLYDATLKKLKDTLPQHAFFQPNRQIIIARKGIRSYQRKGTRRLELQLHPPSDEPVIVAKTKVAEFLKWLGD